MANVDSANPHLNPFKANLKYTLWTLFLDAVQLSPGCKVTWRRQFTFSSKSPGFSGTHLIYLGKMEDQYILPYFHKLFYVLYLSRHFAQFSLKVYMSSWLGKILKFMVFRLPENAYSTQKVKTISIHALSQNFPPGSYHHKHTHTHTRVESRGDSVDLHILVKCSPTKA